MLENVADGERLLQGLMALPKRVADGRSPAGESKNLCGSANRHPDVQVNGDRALIYPLVITATIILFPVLAEAQPQPGTNFPPLLIPLQPSGALPASGTEGGYFFNLRPLGADFGRQLADDGIYVVSRNLTEGLVNMSGGFKQGGSYEQTTFLGFDLDMD